MKYIRSAIIRTANNDNLINFSTNEFASNGGIPLNQKWCEILYTRLDGVKFEHESAVQLSHAIRVVYKTATTPRPRQEQQQNKNHAISL